MKTNMCLGFLVSILMISCGPTPEKTKPSIEVTTETVTVSGPSKTIANLSIKGMACEMSCVSKITQTLKELKGVKNTSINFETERAIDVAAVEFDPNQITANDMADAIQALYDGQYQVTKILVKEEKHVN